MFELLERYQAYREEKKEPYSPLCFRAGCDKGIFKVMFDAGVDEKDLQLGVSRLELETQAPLPDALALFMGMYNASGHGSILFIQDHYVYLKGLLGLGAVLEDSSHNPQTVLRASPEVLEKLAAEKFMVDSGDGTKTKFFMRELWTAGLSLSRTASLDHDFKHDTAMDYESMLKHISKVEEALRQWNQIK